MSRIAIKIGEMHQYNRRIFRGTRANSRLISRDGNHVWIDQHADPLAVSALIVDSLHRQVSDSALLAYTMLLFKKNMTSLFKKDARNRTEHQDARGFRDFPRILKSYHRATVGTFPWIRFPLGSQTDGVQPLGTIRSSPAGERPGETLGGIQNVAYGLTSMVSCQRRSGETCQSVTVGQPDMRLPRVRFTLRRLMLVVAIVAALLTAFDAGRRWERAERVGHGVFDPFDPVEMESR
jgi:hypothetical protein